MCSDEEEIEQILYDIVPYTEWEQEPEVSMFFCIERWFMYVTLWD